jgi:hypothetical protein
MSPTETFDAGMEMEVQKVGRDEIGRERRSRWNKRKV